MRIIRSILANFLAPALFGLSLTVAARAEDFDVAITVDDLPAHASLPVDMTRAAIGRSYLATLKLHRVPEAYGFVNAKRIAEEPDSEIVLKEWRAAGYPLGNHTYSHPNINSLTVAAFEQDVAEGEPILRELMGAEDWHYLRFPFLSAGDAAHHEAIMPYLKAQGYQIAEVSMSFDDWAYSEPYNRCLAKDDRAAIERLKTRYMRGVEDEIARARALSAKVYGRQIPQVLLTHIGGFAAIMLPQVMIMLDAAGAHYVRLAQAESDPAYRGDDANAGKGMLMERTAAEKFIDITTVPAMAGISDLDNVCR